MDIIVAQATSRELTRVKSSSLDLATEVAISDVMSRPLCPAGRSTIDAHSHHQYRESLRRR